MKRDKQGFQAKYSEDDLLNSLTALAKQLGRTPAKRDIAEAGKIANTTYCYHFGSLGNAQKAAGLVPTKSGNQNAYSKEELLNHLKALAKQLRRTPTHDDIAAAGKMSYATYYEHFGSLRKAQKAAGLVPNKKGVRIKYPEKDLVNHLIELAKQLGRTPTHRDIAMEGKMSNADYINHFGSLRRAQKLAGFFPDKQAVTIADDNIPVTDTNPEGMENHNPVSKSHNPIVEKRPCTTNHDKNLLRCPDNKSTYHLTLKEC